MNPNILIIMINITELNSEVERQIFSGWILKIHLNVIHREMPKSISSQKIWKYRNRKIIVRKSKPKKVNIAILISEKTNTKANSIWEKWEMKNFTKDLNDQKDITILNSYVSDNSLKIYKAIFKNKENLANHYWTMES